MAESLSAHDLVIKLIEDHDYVIREAITALRTNTRYALDDRQWEVFYLVRDVVGMAHGFTRNESQEFMRIAVGRV